MFLNNPATYLSVSQFRAQPNDYDLTSYTDTQLQDLLVRASGAADSIMRRSMQPQEVTEFFEGNGTNFLMLCQHPIIYVKQIQLIMPGFAPFTLPLGQLLIDYERGSVRTYSPMIFQSLGVANVFPKNGLPLCVQYAYGVGYPIPAPAFALANGTVSGTLTSQAYDITVTTRTQCGESLESTIQTFTPSTGSIAVNITPQPGAYVYRIYGAVHGQSRTLLAESSATNYGAAVLTVNITSLSPPSNYGALTPPAADTSAWPVPNAIIEATRLLTLGILWEQNNLANRGIYMTRTNKKQISWKSTEGNSGKGIPLYMSQAQELLAPFVLSAVF